MISSLLRLAAIVVSAIVLVSFGLFVIDEARSGSNQTVAKIAGADNPTQSAGNVDQANPPAATERVREKRHGKVREAIDDANDVIVSPFTGIVSPSSSIWLQRAVPALLALLIFGVGVRFLASFLAHGRRR